MGRRARTVVPGVASIVLRRKIGRARRTVFRQFLETAPLRATVLGRSARGIQAVGAKVRAGRFFRAPGPGRGLRRRSGNRWGRGWLLRLRLHDLFSFRVHERVFREATKARINFTKAGGLHLSGVFCNSRQCPHSARCMHEALWEDLWRLRTLYRRRIRRK